MKLYSHQNQTFPQHLHTSIQNKNTTDRIPKAIEASNSFDPYVQIRRCNSALRKTKLNMWLQWTSWASRVCLRNNYTYRTSLAQTRLSPLNRESGCYTIALIHIAQCDEIRVESITSQNWSGSFHIRNPTMMYFLYYLDTKLIRELETFDF